MCACLLCICAVSLDDRDYGQMGGELGKIKLFCSKSKKQGEGGGSQHRQIHHFYGGDFMGVNQIYQNCVETSSAEQKVMKPFAKQTKCCASRDHSTVHKLWAIISSEKNSLVYHPQNHQAKVMWSPNSWPSKSWKTPKSWWSLQWHREGTGIRSQVGAQGGNL